MIRAQLGVEIHLDYGGWTSCCALADRSDAELLCLHLLSMALRASREGGSVNIALRRTQTAWLLTSALESVITQGTGTSAALSNQPVAGKTGTTNNETDKWFCGFTPYYTASIWLGYDDNSKVLSKSISHTKIWQTIMSQIHEGLSTGEFTQPSGIVTAQVCSQSGKLAVAGLCDEAPRGSQVIPEYFSADNVPPEESATPDKVTI